MYTKKSFIGLTLLMALILTGCGGLSSEPSVVATMPSVTENPHASLTLTPQVTVPPVTGKITGTLAMGTSGASVPANQAVMLHNIDASMQEATVNGTADSQGKYSFDNITIQSDHTYFVSTTFEGRAFNSDLAQGDPTTGSMTVPLTIYSSTSDPAAVQVATIVMQLTASTDGLYVVQMTRVNNTGDKVFTTTEQPKDGQYASVRMAFPPTAKIESFNNGEDRYVTDNTTHQVIDTDAVFPNERHLVHFSYQMPYDAASTVLDLPIDYAVAGDVQLIVYPSDLNVTATLGDTTLAASDPLQMGNVLYRPFKATVQSKAGSSLRIEMKGAVTAAQSAALAATTVPASSSSTTASASTGTSGGISHDLLLGLFFGGGLTFILIGTFLFIQDRRRGIMNNQPMLAHAGANVGTKHAAKPAPQDKQAQINPLLAELAQLDDLHSNNRISDAAYQRRRKALKARIAGLMGVEE